MHEGQAFLPLLCSADSNRLVGRTALSHQRLQAFLNCLIWEEEEEATEASMLCHVGWGKLRCTVVTYDHWEGGRLSNDLGPRDDLRPKNYPQLRRRLSALQRPNDPGTTCDHGTSHDHPTTCDMQPWENLRPRDDLLLRTTYDNGTSFSSTYDHRTILVRHPWDDPRPWYELRPWYWHRCYDRWHMCYDRVYRCYDRLYRCFDWMYRCYDRLYRSCDSVQVL